MTSAGKVAGTSFCQDRGDPSHVPWRGRVFGFVLVLF